MKIVILTNDGSLFGKKILNDFISREIIIKAVVVIKQPFKYYWRLFKYVQKRVGIVDSIYFSIKRILADLREQEALFWNNRRLIRNYNEIGVPILYTKGTNSDKTLKILRDISPDLLILGQPGIVKKKLLEIPTIGTLNSHPGILPNYRGIDCAKWAIYNDEFHNVGCSVHWVNEGVDTGNIIIKKAFDFCGDESIETLDEKLNNICISMLTKVVSLIQKGDIASGISQKKYEGKQYFKMSREFEAIVQRKLSEYLAQKNYKQAASF